MAPLAGQESSLIDLRVASSGKEGEDDPDAFGIWLTPEELMGASQWDLANFETVEGISPEEQDQIIPIFTEIGIDTYLCFDFRQPGEPTVFRAWSDEDQWQVWPSFSAFLSDELGYPATTTD